MWNALLPLALVAGCATEGNTISGEWKISTSPFEPPAGGCIGDARVVVRSGSPVVSDTVACDGEGFALVVPFEIKRATVEITDGWSETWTRELSTLDGDVDLGLVVFDHD
jgi:hypothetical protein